ncbi:hypothetical protein BT93_E0432 [Corymbia citriodora subsp. variegata]|nr:hypothetical protein BT93_E0432 [Corymbia citriodora subsp. variegata]
MGKVKLILIICLVLGLCLGQTGANFKSCYRWCYIWCSFESRHTPFYCFIKCMNKCLHSSSHRLYDIISFCKFGCAYSLCTNLSSKGDLGDEKVAGCVDSCSGTCTKHV